jgi:hypothetical protein
MIDKKVNLNLVGIDGNAFSIMASFREQAKREGWINEEIDDVLNDAMSDDYNHLVYTISKYCTLSEDDEVDYIDEDDIDYEDNTSFDEKGSNKYTNSYYT